MKTPRSPRANESCGGMEGFVLFLVSTFKDMGNPGGMIITPKIALKKPGPLQGQQKWLGAGAVGVALLLKGTICGRIPSWKRRCESLEGRPCAFTLIPGGEGELPTQAKTCKCLLDNTAKKLIHGNKD